MIILDLQQTAIANLMVGLGNKHHTDVSVDVGMLRHMILNSVRHINVKFRSDFGEMVIAGEGSANWRRDAFPYYKANRKKSRDASTLDWTMIFDAIREIRNEIAEFLPYASVTVERAEADDVIAHLVATRANDMNRTMIVSGDRDFVQLQKYPNVAQWDHVRKQFVGGDPISHLKSKVIRGDVGDGVPNFLSDDDTFVHESKRQKPITAVKEAAWLAQDPSEFCTTEQLRRNWSRNELLVDLSRTPAEVKQEITDKYEVARTGRTRQGIFEYLASRGLKDLAQHIQDF